MKDNKKKVNKTGKVGFKIIKVFFTLVLLFAALLILAFLIGEITASGSNPVSGYIKSLFETDEITEEKFSFEAYSDNMFEEIDGGLIVVSSNELQLFNASGELICRQVKAFSRPAVNSAAKGAVIWSEGGTDIAIISDTGEITCPDAAGTIITASINDSGYTAISTEESGYKGLVTVYNDKSEAVFKWYSGIGYLIAADVAPSNNSMASAAITETGSRIVAYSLKSEDQLGDYTVEDDLCFDIKYLSDNRICAVTEKKAVFLSGKCEYTAEYDFGGKYIKDYSMDGSGYAVFVIGKYRTGGGGTIVSVDSSGKTLGTIDYNSDVKAINANGRYICVVYSDTVVLYNSSMSELGRIDNAAGVVTALTDSNGHVIVITGEGADEYSF